MAKIVHHIININPNVVNQITLPCGCRVLAARIVDEGTVELALMHPEFPNFFEKVCIIVAYASSEIIEAEDRMIHLATAIGPDKMLHLFARAYQVGRSQLRPAGGFGQ